MIKFLVKTNNTLNFDNPIDIENPNGKVISTLKPFDKVYLVDYEKNEYEYVIKSIIEKDALLVLKSIINLYPTYLFKIDDSFFQEDKLCNILLNTALRTIEKRHENTELQKNYINEFTKKFLELKNLKKEAIK